MVYLGCLLISTILNTRSMVCIVCVGVLVSSSSSCHRVLASSCILPSFHRFLVSLLLLVFVFSCPCSLVSLVSLLPRVFCLRSIVSFSRIIMSLLFWYLCSRVLSPSSILPSFHRFLFSYHHHMSLLLLVFVFSCPCFLVHSCRRFLVSFCFRFLVPMNPRYLRVPSQ